MSKLIFCKFLDENGEPRGRDYTYNSEIDVATGDYVLVEVAKSSDNIQQKRVVVTKADVSPADVPGYEGFKDRIKTIIGIAPVADTPLDEAAEPTTEQTPEVSMEDL